MKPLLCITLLLAVGGARAETPADPVNLDGLVAVALARHPEIAALNLDEVAGRSAASASGRWMDPQWMLGAQALGAMPDSADPTMFMFGVQQMFSLPSTYKASRDRAALDVRWTEGERSRVEADVKEALWETAARLRAQSQQADALDEQIAAAEAALAFGRARYSAGAGSAAQGAPSTAGAPAATSGFPPVVNPPKRAGGGMTGMGAAKAGMGGMPSRSGTMGGMPDGSSPAMGGMTAGMGARMPSSMGGEGLAALLRLDAEVARIRADRAALDARRAGEEARLALIVGEDAARTVAGSPAQFLGPSDAGAAAPVAALQPERVLAATSIKMADADIKVARSGRLPSFMLATDLRVMPEGMVDGVDAEIGVTVPVWSGAKGRVDAATATSEAASRRSEAVDRALADAIASARADEAEAVARARALSEVAVPRARAAWDATVAVWSAGGGSAADLVLAWQTEVAVTRDTVDAELATELARARIARLEGT